MNEEKRNPYAPTQAPLADERELSRLNPESEGTLEYGGFWRRFGALLIDFLILTPIYVLNYFGAQYSKMFYVWNFIPGILIALFYWVWLVQKYGGTPGKRILDMRIALVSGEPITPRAALLRYSVIAILTVIQSFGLLMATRGLSDETYLSLSYFAKMQALSAAAPPYYTWIAWVTQAWMVGVAISMLCNRRRRALHDFIAGTVVLRERR